MSLTRPGVSDKGNQQILEAAAEAFNRRGFAATSIDDIADALGATKGRIYHYYRSKLDIFLDVLVASMRDLLEKLQPILTDSERSPEQRLYDAAYMHATTMMTRRSFSRVAIQGLEAPVLAEAQTKRADAVNLFIGLRDRYEDGFADLVEQGRASGVFRDVDPRLATKPIFGALNWINMWYDPAQESQAGVAAIAEEFAVFIVNGLRRREPVPGP
ncbi:TetR/AcrR family transcriptional regulator [Salinactinospora qingdaonensis]